MKKLMIALAAVALAAASQAATFKWTTSAVPYGINAATVTDNGTYTAGTTQMKNKGTWSFILSIYESDTGVLVGQSTSSSVKFGLTNAKVNTDFIEISSAADSTDYKYVLVITGTQTDLAARGTDGAYDYSGATMTAEVKGTVTTISMGTTEFSTAAPTSWTLSGIESVPEPTSGLLMLVGLAGLALKRKRA